MAMVVPSLPILLTGSTIVASPTNRTHCFITSSIWHVPAFLHAHRRGNVLLAGWRLNGIVLLQSGALFSVLAGVNRSLSGGAGDRADLIGRDP
jgi:hypothetical protein